MLGLAPCPLRLMHPVDAAGPVLGDALLTALVLYGLWRGVIWLQRAAEPRDLVTSAKYRSARQALARCTRAKIDAPSDPKGDR